MNDEFEAEGGRYALLAFSIPEDQLTERFV